MGHEQKAIYKWEELKKDFAAAYNLYVRRSGPASEQNYLTYLIHNGCRNEIIRAKRKKTSKK